MGAFSQHASNFQKRRKIIGYSERNHSRRYDACDAVDLSEQDRQRQIQDCGDRAVDGHALEMSRGIEQTTADQKSR